MDVASSTLSAAGTASAKVRTVPTQRAGRRVLSRAKPRDPSEAMRRGDREALAALIRLHQGAVYGYLRVRLVEAADAEDLTQEAFLRCYQSRARFPGDEAARCWLLGIARNLLREHVRRVARRRETPWTELCLEVDALAEGPVEHENEALAHLPACVQSLGESARHALEMRYRDRLTLASIGGMLQRSEGAVKLLMYRARHALKHCIDRKLRMGQP
jgi:RNA polymerase sigma-70 factor (ECF subfamily)